MNSGGEPACGLPADFGQKSYKGPELTNGPFLQHKEKAQRFIESFLNIINKMNVTAGVGRCRIGGHMNTSIMARYPSFAPLVRYLSSCATKMGRSLVRAVPHHARDRPDMPRTRDQPAAIFQQVPTEKASQFRD
jgi:hypothetical protein